MRGFWGEEDDGAAAHFAGDDFKGGVLHDHFGEGQLGFAGAGEDGDDALADVADEGGGDDLGDGGADDLAEGIDGEAA